MPVDFAELYTLIGVGPECSLDAFKQACRKRIGELHPDRRAATLIDDRLPVQELISLYASAIRFHREHGRLPGAVPTSTRATIKDTRDSGTNDAPAPELLEIDAPVRTTANSRDRRIPLLVVLAIALVLVLVGSWKRDDAEDAPLPVAGEDTAPTVAEAVTSDTGALRIGMDHDAVLALEGEPISRGEQDWDYSPSWVRFEEGRLVDWYSSPLRPLHTSSRTPPPSTDEER